MGWGAYHAIIIDFFGLTRQRCSHKVGFLFEGWHIYKLFWDTKVKAPLGATKRAHYGVQILGNEGFYCGSRKGYYGLRGEHHLS